MKEIILYEASDGKRYKTRRGCRMHEKRLESKEDRSAKELKAANEKVDLCRRVLIEYLSYVPKALAAYQFSKENAKEFLKIRRGLLSDDQRLYMTIRALSGYREHRTEYLNAMNIVAKSRSDLKTAISRRDELLPLTSSKRRKGKNGNKR